MTSPYADDLDLALGLADAADRISLSRFASGDLRIETKPDLTPVSDADRAIEESLRSRLGNSRAHDAVSGEEFGDTGTGSRRWVIDPIDGTKNYVRGVPVWASLIALTDGDAPVVGVVSAPALGRRWWAAEGGGAWVRRLDEPPRRISVSRVADLGDASLSYASLAAWGERRDAFVALTERVWRSRAYGDFWSYMLVAEGAVDVAAEPDLALWDMAALAPIVTEAGGRFTSVEGTDGVAGPGAAASNGLLHDAFIAALRA